MKHIFRKCKFFVHTRLQKCKKSQKHKMFIYTMIIYMLCSLKLMLIKKNKINTKILYYINNFTAIQQNNLNLHRIDENNRNYYIINRQGAHCIWFW